jgi:hypothetical protein
LAGTSENNSEFVMNSPAKILIFGSCVSRDILNYPQAKAQFVLIDYYARSSIASLGARPIEMPSTVQNISSKFQRRMVERDIRKDFLNDLARLQFDVLLIDLIDERFSLYVEPEGRACTLSSELLCSGFLKDAVTASRISSGSEEFWRLWEAGWLILVNRLRDLRHLGRLRVNQVFWGARTENGGNFEPHYSSRRIDQANQFLDRMYQRISVDIPSDQFLRFDQGLMTGSVTHKWGISPFHYVDAYYHAAIQQLCAGSSQEKKITASKATVTSHANFSINKVILDHEGDELVATVAFEAPQVVQFAFYVFRNGERIHTQGYSPDATLRLCIKSEPGLYRVFAFLLTPQGTKITKYSNPLFLHPVAYTLEQVIKKHQPKERTLLLQSQSWKYPALYYAGKLQQPLFVMLSAAIDRSKHSLPVFNRWTWAQAGKFPGHVLCIADPTLELHEDMKLGWYLGTAEHDASEELSKFILRFAEALGISADKIIIWGSSGGGFSALSLASRIEKATAVAINAQTDIFAYELVRTIEAMKKNCFGNQTTQHIQEHFGPRVNMAQAWRSNRNSRAILIQNKLDTHHYACHFKPYWEALGGGAEGGASADGRHYAWLYNDPNGHAPESEQMIPGILSLIDQVPFTASTVMPTVPEPKV